VKLAHTHFARPADAAGPTVPTTVWRVSADHRIAIIGAGFSGLGAAIRLKTAGVEDFVVLERAADVGGTWRANTYPGCQCDVPSHLYSYSFAPNPNWSRTFSRQGEIWEYLCACVERFDLGPHLRLGVEVRECSWGDATGSWLLETSAGPLSAVVVVAAMGALSEPSMPTLPGIESFQGPLFHSAAWRHDVDLRGARIALLGTGASAIQIAPEIAPVAGELVVYQRTPPWILPHPDRPIRTRERALFRAVPFAQRAVRDSIASARETLVLGFRHPPLGRPGEALARRHLERQVADPVLREALRPTYRFGCKRILISNRYYPALQQPNVTLVPHAVAEIRAHSVLAADGVERPADVVIAATGFSASDPPVAHHIRGRDGRTLAEHWSGAPQAYKGTTIAGFPNLFMMLGPHTGLGHTSVLLMIEAQIGYLVAAVHAMDEGRIAVLEPRPDAQAAFVATVRRRAHGTVWESGGCASWYLDAGGHSILWPDSAWRFRRALRRFDLTSYLARPYSSDSA
jgi:cation diffusion facilitator CzcD-associated flavoprotein CzcO